MLPQNPSAQEGSDKKPLLTPAEHASLRDKLAKFLADEAAVAMGGKDREKNVDKKAKSKAAWDAEWKKAEAKVAKTGILLASTADVSAIFENCFTVKPPKNSPGELRKEQVSDTDIEFSYMLPKSYKNTVPTRMVFLLTGSGGANGATMWTKASDYYGATWAKSATEADAIFHIPTIPAQLELDPIPDYSREGAEAEEDKRSRMMLASLGTMMQMANIDRRRIVLDCGRGNSGYGLRFMTLFPDRWAGAILREPTAVDDLRLGTLTGIPILLVRTAATAATVDALAKRLEEISPKKITVLDAADEYPHKALTPKIEEWMAGCRRNMVPSRIVIEPNHDQFNRAYWAKIDVANPLLTSAPDKKARLEVVAERAVNRITVKTVGVESFTLMLNDDLVDLDKEFTVVINDKAVTEKKTRVLRDLKDNVVTRMDWDYLFPVKFSTTVPK
ncbi:MAG: hypothetical protein JNK15_17200 [Planctomycetes bacterium]|nr:hypothetical protein [Planctomycetota bacterium]